MSEQVLDIVRAYYESFRAGGGELVTARLSEVLDPGFVLESPLVAERVGGPASGEVAVSLASAVAPLLANATIEALYCTPTGEGVVALIHFPSPAGTITQSEHFDVEPSTGRITRLRSYYDPRPLLSASGS